MARSSSVVFRPTFSENPGWRRLRFATTSSMCVISVLRHHAGEYAGSIFKRKIEDIARVGMTLLGRAVAESSARPGQVRHLCRDAERWYVLFVGPATDGGARPTLSQESAASVRMTAYSTSPSSEPHAVMGRLEAHTTQEKRFLYYMKQHKNSCWRELF